MSAIDTDSQLDPVRVGVVTLVTTSTTQEAVAELRRHAMQVELVAADVLHGAPELAVYIISVDVAFAAMIAANIVEWAASTPLRPGLIGLVEGGGVRDCEALLEAGFDDAVVTSISTRELASRVRAVHRRVHWKGSSNGRLRYGELTLDLYGRSVWIEGRAIALTSIELAVLRELIKVQGRPLSRAELLDAAWGEGDLEISERAVDNVILRLRRKLPTPDLIETVRSVGFRLAKRLP
ncbi:MAG: response regulator transcription factor [Deltaproteobacteria bacterium]|nr:response regulator transcription factor [Deltaproteobacteria bacterium]